MKTINQIAVECAARSEHSYTKVENFQPHTWVLEAMQEYAKQCCDELNLKIEQLETDLTVAKMLIDDGFIKESAKKIISTPNVAENK